MLTWGEVVSKGYMVGRDAERIHCGERTRGPIKAIYFDPEGLVIERESAATTLDSENEVTEWDNPEPARRLVLPRIRPDTPIKEGDFTRKLVLRESTEDKEKIIIHPQGDNIL